MCYSYIYEFLEMLSLHHFLILFFVLFSIFLYTWLHRHNHTKKPPPSPPKLPILGNLLQLGKAPHRSLRALSDKYGELMLLYLGSKPTLVVSSANAAKEMMKTHDVIFSNRPPLKMARKLLYNGKDVAFSNNREYWRQMRSMCVLHLLSNIKVRSFRTIREDETLLMVEKIKGSDRNTGVNLSELMVTLPYDEVRRSVFGRKYDGKESKVGSDFNYLVHELSDLLGAVTMEDFMPWLSWIDKLTGLDSKTDKVAKGLDLFFEGLLEKHISSRSIHGNGDSDDGNKQMKALVDFLIDAMEDDLTDTHIDRESIKALTLDMFAAGTETTFVLMEWGMSELLRHPRVMNKLQQEVRTITQGKEIVNEDDLQKMKYLKAVIKETLRLYPPLPLLVSRELTSDVQINGYEIKAKTQVFTNSWAIHRDPSMWEKPDEYYPERFLDSSVDFKGKDFQLIPFGAGRRMCPGTQFATSIAELALANLVNAFDWTLPGGAQGESLGMEETSGISVRRKNPLLVVPTPHSNLQKIN